MASAPEPVPVPVVQQGSDTKEGGMTDDKFGTTHLEVEDLKHHLNGEEDIVARMNNLDPPVTWEEEKKVRRKIDLRLPPFLLLLYMFTWLDVSATCPDNSCTRVW
jgi:hypothetical protein